MKIWKRPPTWHAKSSLPVSVRGLKKSCLLKLSVERCVDRKCYFSVLLVGAVDRVGDRLRMPRAISFFFGRCGGTLKLWSSLALPLRSFYVSCVSVDRNLTPGFAPLLRFPPSSQTTPASWRRVDLFLFVTSVQNRCFICFLRLPFLPNYNWL